MQMRAEKMAGRSLSCPLFSVPGAPCTPALLVCEFPPFPPFPASTRAHGSVVLKIRGLRDFVEPGKKSLNLFEGDGNSQNNLKTEKKKGD